MNAAIESAQVALTERTRSANEERAKIATAEQSVATAETTLQNAVDAFKAKPTTATATAKLVAEQLLANAREALAQVQAEAQPVLMSETRAKLLCDYFKAFESFASFDADQDALIVKLLEGEQIIHECVNALKARLEEANANGRLAVAMASQLGIETTAHGSRPDSCSIDEVRRRLQERYGSQWAHGDWRIPVASWIKYF